MNNLVFNTVAEELKTTIYAQSLDGSIQPLQIDSNSNLLIGGNVTISNTSLTVAINSPITIANDSLTVAVSNSITIANASLTVTGSVSINTPITIANSSLTVAGSVDINNPITIANDSLTVAINAPITIANESLTVAVNNPITIANASLTVAGAVTINNATLTVFNAGNAFTALTISNAAVGASTILLNNTDISQIKTASLFLYTPSTTMTVSLQLSPTTNSDDYITDANYSGSTRRFIAISKFAHYFRLLCSATPASTITVYYNGQY